MEDDGLVFGWLAQVAGIAAALHIELHTLAGIPPVGKLSLDHCIYQVNLFDPQVPQIYLSGGKCTHLSPYKSFLSDILF